jgi:hypothetical protein
MSRAPERGPVNGGEVRGAVELRKSELEAAIDRALPGPAQATDDLVWPQIAFFTARERPKLHKLQPSTYEVLWGIRLGLVSPEGQGVGFTCSQGMTARNLAAALRTCADRLDEIAGCVELKLEVPAFDPARLAAAREAELAAAVQAAIGGVQPAAPSAAAPGAQPVDKPETGVSSHGPEVQPAASPGGSEPGSQH